MNFLPRPNPALVRWSVIEDHTSWEPLKETPAEAWARCRPWIIAALERSPGLETIEDVERNIEYGVYVFWPSKNCAVITRIDEYPTARALIAVHGGGNLDELMHVVIPQLEEFAACNGFDYFGGEGRKGWARVLENNGYELAFITMLKPLRKN